MFQCTICGIKFATEDGLDNHYAQHDREGSCPERMSYNEYKEEMEFLNACENMSPRDAAKWCRENR